MFADMCLFSLNSKSLGLVISPYAVPTVWPVQLCLRLSVHHLDTRFNKNYYIGHSVSKICILCQ
jgi:hypothetical protein